MSVVIPVRDGERHLGNVLKALRREGPDEVLVIDSGSHDRSKEIAREGGADLIEIEPADFGHGRTRNLGAERTTGQLICFLTQDAEPIEGWLGAYCEAFGIAERIGAAYGPHLPRDETSPMIARELLEFFAGFSPAGTPVVQGPDGPVFLSNVNACYRRECWAEIRFPEVPYAEDQAFARAMLAAGWRKVFHPGAAVLHAHDYGPVEFMRRYFDEYRGLRETLGHVERFSPRFVAGVARRQVAGDWRWMRERGWPAPRRAAWAARSLVHHAGRQVFAGLGSRASRLPAPVRRSLSLERRDGAAPLAPTETIGGEDEVPRGRTIGPTLTELPWSEMLRLSRDGQATLLDTAHGVADRPCLHIAVVIPPFARGSGGHASIFQLIRGLERMGHSCSIWLLDPLGRHSTERPAVLRRRIVEEFVPLEAPVFKGFEYWYGADVVVATGWETALPSVLLEGCHARAYLVHDHEPEFYAMSPEAVWAEQTYTLDLYPISASTWLRDLMRERYGRDGSWFRFGVDHGVYRPRRVERRRDTIMFYARYYTPRRAVPLGLLALHELWRRRPDVRIVLFGSEEPPATSFPYEFLGVVSPEVLAWRYSEATVGICLSLTNYSLIPQEMMACGLPCVDLAGRSSEAVFGRDGPVEFAEFDPLSIADAAEALLTDEKRWAQRSNAGLAFVEDATWELAARQVEKGLRQALREREAPLTRGATQA